MRNGDYKIMKIELLLRLMTFQLHYGLKSTLHHLIRTEANLPNSNSQSIAIDILCR